MTAVLPPYSPQTNSTPPELAETLAIRPWLKLYNKLPEKGIYIYIYIGMGGKGIFMELRAQKRKSWIK